MLKNKVALVGRLDVACNNAGIGGPSAPVAQYPLEGWATNSAYTAAKHGVVGLTQATALEA